MTQVASIHDNAASLRPIDIPLDEIYSDSEFNCRGQITPWDVMDLTNDIKIRGLQTPILVQPHVQGKFKYRIIAGHRRHMACRMAGKDTIAAIVKSNLNETDALVWNLTENLKRKDLNMVQEAKAIEKFFLRGWSPDRVAKELGVPRGWARDRAMILDLPDEIQTEIAAGILKMTDIKTIHGLTSIEQQLEAARQMKDKKELGRYGEVDGKLIKKRATNAARPRPQSEIMAVQATIYAILGPSLTTVAMSWCQGEVDDLTLHTAIRDEALKVSKVHVIPPSFIKDVKGITDDSALKTPASVSQESVSPESVSQESVSDESVTNSMHGQVKNA